MSVAAASCGGVSGSDDDNGGGDKKEKGIMLQIPVSPPPPSTDGDTDDDEDDENEAGHESKAKRRSTLDCLGSLEASLPMKRGISSHYHGRSKSFGNLTELSIEDSKDLGKKEHAVNKRRRLLIAHEYDHHKSLHGSGRSSYLTHASSMPAFLSDHLKNEDEDEEHNNEDNEKGNDR